MYVEQQISAVHSKMLVYHENLKRLRKRLEIVRQVYAAPKLYAAAIVEVYRRRMYSSQFTFVSCVIKLLGFKCIGKQPYSIYTSQKKKRNTRIFAVFFSIVSSLNHSVNR